MVDSSNTHNKRFWRWNSSMRLEQRTRPYFRASPRTLPLNRFGDSCQFGQPAKKKTTRISIQRKKWPESRYKEQVSNSQLLASCAPVLAVFAFHVPCRHSLMHRPSAELKRQGLEPTDLFRHIRKQQIIGWAMRRDLLAKPTEPTFWRRWRKRDSASDCGSRRWRRRRSRSWWSVAVLRRHMRVVRLANRR